MTNLQKDRNKAKLKYLCNQVLSEETPRVLLNHLQELHQLLLQIGVIDIHDSNFNRDLITPSGKAIAPIWAAMCMTDFLRTQRFFRGIYQAVKDTMKKHPDERIHILYAGTGPFATLALPVMSLFSKDEVSITLLEIQDTSINVLHKILEYFEFKDHVSALIQTDATSYTSEKSTKVHIVISETMQHALEKEPQVEITINLAHQVDDETIWIPEDIKIGASLMNMKKDNDRQMGILPANESSYIDLGPIFNLNKKCAKKLFKELSAFDEVQYQVSEKTILNYPWLVLMTTIHIYGDQYLMPWESGLCAPRIIANLSNYNPMPEQVAFWYKTGSSPGFLYKFLYS